MQILEFKKGDVVPNWLLVRAAKVSCIFDADCTVMKPKGVTGGVHIKWNIEESNTVISIANDKGERVFSPFELYLTSFGTAKPKVDKRMVEDFLKDYHFKRRNLELMTQ